MNIYGSFNEKMYSIETSVS